MKAGSPGNHDSQQSLKKRRSREEIRNQLLADLREARETWATLANAISEWKPSAERDEAVRRLWQGWLEIAELEASLKTGKDSTRIFARIISRDLKAYANTIQGLAQKGNKQFFMDLGRFLSGELKSGTVDQQKRDIAMLVCMNPSITAKEAVRKLKVQCGWEMSEDAFKMAKMRLAEFPRKQAKSPKIRSRRR